MNVKMPCKTLSAVLAGMLNTRRTRLADQVPCRLEAFDGRFKLTAALDNSIVRWADDLRDDISQDGDATVTIASSETSRRLSGPPTPQALTWTGWPRPIGLPRPSIFAGRCRSKVGL